MPSPFPGMDPFVEADRRFEDFHAKLVGEIERSLARAVPPGYFVALGERSYVALVAPGGGEDERAMLPDVGVHAATRGKKGRRGKRADRGGHLAEERAGPVTMMALVEAPFRETFVEVRHRHREERLVTAIEVLSPSNKRPRSRGRALYLRKRQAFLAGSANLVEIDLLRRGRRMPMVDDWPKSPYYLLVCRREEAPRCGVWPASSVRPLPPIPVPLTPPDADIPLDLRPLIDEIYDRSRYEDVIDYKDPIRRRLSAEELAFLKPRGRRS